MRTLALDVGQKRIGVAVSDALNITAQPVQTYTRSGNVGRDVDYLLGLAARYAPCRLLLGLPRNMDGTEGPQAERVRRFAALLAEKGAGEILFWDERLTTAAARQVLLEADVSRKNRKQVIDKLAATLILQSYMDSQG
ncbi:MAG: Holliday junction resolvase RuvX [Clostridiales bacterium]|nr:Holliday junction resolvase RuvX [Clostridiales bacterium]